MKQAHLIFIRGMLCLAQNYGTFKMIANIKHSCWNSQLMDMCASCKCLLSLSVFWSIQTLVRNMAIVQQNIEIVIPIVQLNRSTHTVLMEPR